MMVKWPIHELLIFEIVKSLENSLSIVKGCDAGKKDLLMKLLCNGNELSTFTYIKGLFLAQIIRLVT